MHEQAQRPEALRPGAAEESWPAGWKWAPAAVAFVPLGVSAARGNLARHLTPGQEAVFAYLRTHTPDGTRVMYPGEVILAEARRPGGAGEPGRSGASP